MYIAQQFSQAEDVLDILPNCRNSSRLLWEFKYVYLNPSIYYLKRNGNQGLSRGQYPSSQRARAGLAPAPPDHPGPSRRGGSGRGAGLGGPARPRLESQLPQMLTRALELVPALCEPPFPRCEVRVGPHAPSWVWVIPEVGQGGAGWGCSSGALTCVHHSCCCKRPYPHR